MQMRNSMIVVLQINYSQDQVPLYVPGIHSPRHISSVSVSVNICNCSYQVMLDFDILFPEENHYSFSNLSF
ncbi:hypothetical protein HZ326_6927 [Fusarium oxysporum f. sp. albedinis]|nr:hypothetical protein HZ326_6927 [Fusarium oxysporum f. sp. albedinis]